jgi:hypothetical protein
MAVSVLGMLFVLKAPKDGLETTIQRGLGMVTGEWA